jgi:hypothetical protein
MLLSATVIMGQSPAAPAAQPAQPAVLHLVGDSRVDGAAASEGMTIFDRNVVEALRNYVDFTLPGSTVRVLPAAKVQYGANRVELQDGGATVNTSSEFAVHMNCLSVTPVSTSQTAYAVIPHDGRLFVTTEKGEVLVKGSRREMRVPEGKTLAIGAWCKPGEYMQWAGNNELPLKVLYGAVVGASPSIFLWRRCEKSSPDRPDCGPSNSSH